jgi:IgA Peptidase M64
MADPLTWKDGEGYDIHVLRGGPSSKALTEGLNLDPDGLSPFFEPHFKGAPNNHGVAVNTITGEVTATGQPSPPQPKFPNFNFLMTARQTLVGEKLETIIRIHVHDSVKKIWLTPSPLTLHETPHQVSNQRFTVLALFDDDTVGDITDWPQLTYTSSNQFVVNVNNVGDIFHGDEEIIGGRLLPGDFSADNVDITVALKLDSPSIDLSATAKVIPKPPWAELARDLKTTKVEWVGGKMRPDPKQDNADQPNSIESVFENGPNILFVSEGFSREKDFRKIVNVIVNSQLRANPSLEPFRLLADSINYWSVFVESREDSVSVLGDYEIGGSVPKQTASEVPLPRPPIQPQWSIENMIHEAGLPLPSDVPAPNGAAWLASRAPLYDLPANVTVDAKALKAWNDLRHRSLLNERDSAFGLAHGDRPRASGQGKSEEQLLNDPRRTNQESLADFVEHLKFVNRFEIGSRAWHHESGKDRRLVCFVCQSEKIGGAATPFVVTGGVAAPFFFTASTGKSDAVTVKPAKLGNGLDLVTPPMGVSFSAPVVGSVVAHECGHAFGLGDEYGDLRLGVSPPPRDFNHPNLQQEAAIVFPPGPPRVFDADKILWLWPRINKAGVLAGPPDDQGNPQANKLLVRLRAGHGKPFANGDLVRIRKVPVRKTTASDPHARILFRVVVEGDDSVTVEYVTPSGPRFDVKDPDLSDPAQVFRLNRTSIRPGIEKMLVADPIKAHIAASDRPLNANAGPAAQGAACVPGDKPKAAATPTNLPPLAKTPSPSVQIIGLYDGGGYRDCGVFRPTGQCKMRSVFDKTALFCHVCRYVIVDTVDPTKHEDLDKSYPEVEP